MEADDAKATALPQDIKRLLEHGLELFEFAIDENANGLERFRRGMFPLTTRRRGGGDYVGELGRRCKRRAFARRYNSPRDA